MDRIVTKKRMEILADWEENIKAARIKAISDQQTHINDAKVTCILIIVNLQYKNLKNFKHRRSYTPNYVQKFTLC